MNAQDLENLALEIRKGNAERGFFPRGMRDPLDAAVAICLTHSELSEMMEELRQIEPRSGKQWPAEWEEWADVFIRLLDYAAGRNFAHFALEVVSDKLAYNAGRPHKHGKVF